MAVSKKYINVAFILLCVLLCLRVSSSYAAAVELPNVTEIQQKMDAVVDSTPVFTEKELKSAQKNLEKGFGLYQKGKFDKSIQYYKKALRKIPTLSYGYYHLALSQYSLNNPSEAYKNIIRALVLDPGMEHAHVLKYSLLEMLGYPDEALAGLKHLLTINPESSLAWFNLGVTQANLKRYSEAETSFMEAHKLDRANPSPLYFLFVSAAMQGYTYEEEVWLERFLELAPDNDVRRKIAQKRWAELTEKQVYVDPNSKSPELDLMEGLLRSEWRIKKHREHYPDERGYRPSLAEEREVAMTLLALGYSKGGEAKYQGSDRLVVFAELQVNGYLEAYFYVLLKSKLGKEDLLWGEENTELINSYLAWKEAVSR